VHPAFGVDGPRCVEGLRELGSYFGGEALPAIREGFCHGTWLVRKWSAMYLAHHADAKSLTAVLPLLRDQKNQVQLWAVHSLACHTCKLGDNPIDIVPLLIERIELDESIRIVERGEPT
jgi:hypothetical protein